MQHNSPCVPRTSGIKLFLHSNRGVIGAKRRKVRERKRERERKGRKEMEEKNGERKKEREWGKGWHWMFHRDVTKAVLSHAHDEGEHWEEKILTFGNVPLPSVGEMKGWPKKSAPLTKKKWPIWLSFCETEDPLRLFKLSHSLAEIWLKEVQPAINYQRTLNRGHRAPLFRASNRWLLGSLARRWSPSFDYRGYRSMEN